jgi:hypothetical protein
MTPEIEEFAKSLVEQVRDLAIGSNDVALRPAGKSPVAKRWAQAAARQTPMEFAATVIPDIVDDTTFYLLNAIDQGELKLTYTAPNGTVVDLTEQGLGELAGWYMGSEGWREKYSKERFVDDCADLR